MTTTFTTGDTAPALTGTVNADLTGAAVEVNIKRPLGAAALTKTATIVDDEGGGWSVEWEEDDLSVPGDHYVEVQVTFSDTTVQTFALDTNDRPVFFKVRTQNA